MVLGRNTIGVFGDDRDGMVVRTKRADDVGLDHDEVVVTIKMKVTKTDKWLR